MIADAQASAKRRLAALGPGRALPLSDSANSEGVRAPALP
jgi:hypothetical protein